MKPEIKAAAEAKGCAGAMQAMPAIFVAAAAVSTHLRNPFRSSADADSALLAQAMNHLLN